MSNLKLSPPQKYASPKPFPQILSQGSEFLVQFWGVRGLIPTPGSHTIRYGGNTGCVEMQVGGKHLVFDGGTGLRLLGKSMLQLRSPLKAHLFFTNSQSNRIQGFPFFAPAFVSENCLHIYGTAALNGASIKQCLCDQMLQPHFPYPFQLMQSELHFHNLTSGKVVKIDDITITTAIINHEQKSIGYRVSWQEYSVAYITDVSKIANEVDQKYIAQLTKGVNLLIANATYALPAARNYNSPDFHWDTAVDLATTANVKQLVISHHHPDDDDDFLDQVQVDVKSVFPKALLAKEGLVLTVV
ncbi:MBL fold metallo-hydrolase [Brasilonema sp. UFV-L1]|uniref:MBL fold metallo-hydrolase n=1 Tax=Brasilonema sp. UFV-L1 TaxID=2234130 RepID=UPI00145D6286|nr:MBL fold metallo-hydrolase [Brasilonema sp. UFV-L1]NMG06573.1 MBL fold metallo-hydrolase [Brasilonema sp. UFV-L1]